MPKASNPMQNQGMGLIQPVPVRPQECRHWSMTPQLTSIGSHRGNAGLINTELQPKGCGTFNPAN